MKKRLLFFAVAIVVSMNVMAISHDPYVGSRIFWDTASRKTVFSSGGYGRLIQLQDGRLMACTESGGICVAYSSNKGSTWTSAQKIVTNTNNTPNCVPDLIQLMDGTIIVAYNPRPSSPYTEDRHFGMRCKRSTDNGATWSDEIFVHDASYLWNDGCWEPSMLQLPSGEVQLYFADEGPYTSSNEQQISMCRSFDGGLTWGEAELVSYRAGSRDGMPVPVILNDGETIAVAIEDNGWSGFGSFIPTIVTCPLSTNWNNYWVNANSENRWQAVNYSFCYKALGGAPYLRVLPWGETILSHQSTYGAGENQMWIYVGNEDAKDFKAMSSPFSLGDSDNALWNSVAVIDTGIVVAFGGISGHDEIIKGYPAQRLFASYGTPTLDGTQARDEGYYRVNAAQMILGTECGVRFTGDFAYNDDSLYFTTRVSDRIQFPIKNTTYSDGLFLYLDMKNTCTIAPDPENYRFFLRLDSTVWAYQGAGTKWVSMDESPVHMVVKPSKNYYIIEAAMPWSMFGFDKAPTEQIMRANIELSNRTSESSAEVTKEMLPDATSRASWTWMELRLLPNPDPTSISQTVWNDDIRLAVDHGTISVESDVEVVSADVYSIDGKLVGRKEKAGNQFSINTSTEGIVVVRMQLKNGRQLCKKVAI